MEQRHMQMRYQLAANQIRDFSMAQRQLLARRLASEMADLKESAEAERSNFLDKQAQEKKEFLKREKYDQKKQLAEFQRNLRAGNPESGPLPKDTLAKFQERWRQTANRNLQQLESRQRAQLRALDTKWMSRFTELDQQQADKKNILVDQETKRLRELNEEHQRELKVHSDTFARKIARRTLFVLLSDIYILWNLVSALRWLASNGIKCECGGHRISLRRPHRHHHHSRSTLGTSFSQSLSQSGRQARALTHSLDNLAIEEEEVDANNGNGSDHQRYSSSSASSISASRPDGSGDCQRTSSADANDYCPGYRL
ncbi:unnamed protein product [Dibothriocephalus latus]|uniref:Uncharacterized protein n=1 Tax=Dibothriocephalus latus TaxID=60516 RepID=A0A3P7MVF4_DIBLA|nr:unnamed protein product [Dibothriocephalus latus]